jgi:para-nitrobenzyl esterase
LGWNFDDRVSGPPVKAEAYKIQLQKQYGANAEKVLQYYPATNDSIAAISQDNLNRDAFFGVQGFAWANAQLQKGKSNIYVYNFNRKLPAYTVASNFGAFHTGEVPYVFNNLKTVNRPWQDIDMQLADQMSTYWINFAKTGNPNGSKLTQWPTYTKQKGQVMILAEKIRQEELPFKQGLEVLSTLY